MNGINSKSSTTTSAKKTHSPVKSIETAGSLAMNNQNPFAGIFSTPLYDMFSSTNPFAVDYSMYSDFSDGQSVAYNGGFLGGFYSAVTALGGFSSFSDGGSSFGGGFSGASCGASCGDCGGGFTSVC